MKKISLSRNELIAQIPTSFTAIGNRVVSADNSTIANFRLGTNNTQDEAEVYAQMFALRILPAEPDRIIFKLI